MSKRTGKQLKNKKKGKKNKKKKSKKNKKKKKKTNKKNKNKKKNKSKRKGKKLKKGKKTKTKSKGQEKYAYEFVGLDLTNCYEFWTYDLLNGHNSFKVLDIEICFIYLGLDMKVQYY